MSGQLRIACAACGYGAEVDAPESGLPDALQCPMCGTWIRDLAAEVEAAGRPAPEPEPAEDSVGIAACLVDTGTGRLEEQYPLTGVTTIVGRDNSDINIPDPTMSIHHFKIEWRHGEYFITDLGSTNHTRVNGRLIETTTLESGDRIQAGLTVLVFLAGGSA